MLKFYTGIPLWLQFLNSVENHYSGWMDELVAIDCMDTCIHNS